MSWPSDWLRGVLPLAVLGILSRGRTYGYAVAVALAEAGVGQVKGGTLYPLLGRLETDGLVESTWEAGDGGPGRKYFELTSAGQAELADRAALWQEFTTTVTGVVTGTASTKGES